VRWDIEWDFGGKKRETRREYYARFGQSAPVLTGLPKRGAYIFRWFADLSAQRAYGNGYPQALGFTEILAWQNLTGVRMMQWELDALLRMDSTFRAEIGAGISAENARKIGGANG